MAIFDAYGAGFEFAHRTKKRPWGLSRPSYDARNDGHSYHSHPLWGQSPTHTSPIAYIPTPPGSYTDDTQMMLAVAELMLAQPDPHTWTPHTIADAFVRTFHRDPRLGYSKGFYTFLQNTKTADAFLSGIRPHSQRCGGAMRSPLLGALQDASLVRDIALFQASLTHATHHGLLYAAQTALAFHYSYFNLGPQNFNSLTEFLCDLLHCRPDPPWQGPTTVSAESVTRAALTIVYSNTNNTASEVLRACAETRGDVDSIAAIAGTLLFARNDFEVDIPQTLLDELESGPYGRTYLRKIDAQFVQRFAQNI